MTLEKLIDNAWYPEGNYYTENGLAGAAFELGRSNGADQIRVRNESAPRYVTLHVLVNVPGENGTTEQVWMEHGSYQVDNLTPLVRAVAMLKENPNCSDFLVI